LSLTVGADELILRGKLNLSLLWSSVLMQFSINEVQNQSVCFVFLFFFFINVFDKGEVIGLV